MHQASETPLPANLDTPCVVVDEARLHSNIAAMQARANQWNVALKPHVKTHKCLEIARMQLEMGSAGLTAAKVDEALVFLAAFFPPPAVTLAYPLVSGAKLDRLIVGAGNADLILAADSETGVDILSLGAQRHDRQLKVMLKVDVGLHRCGVPPEDPRLVDLAKRIHKAKGLELAGILSHAGHSYAAQDAREARLLAQKEAEAMTRAKERIEAAGIPVREVSVGATPTLLAARDFGPATEIRPGNYVFLDRACIRLGLAEPRHCALYVVATVVSVNPEHAILDAGSKTLSSDSGAHGAKGLEGYGLAWPLADAAYESKPLVIEKLSEEHGFLRLSPEADFSPEVGDMVRILPNHACAVANLAEGFLVAGPSKETYWDVAARAKVR